MFESSGGFRSNGGIGSSGRIEARDAIGTSGSLASARSPASLAPLSVDVFALLRHAGAGGAGKTSAAGVGSRGDVALSGPLIARAAVRGPVQLGLAALLALLDLDRDPSRLGAELGESGLLDAVESIARLEGHLSGLRQRVLAALCDLPCDPQPDLDSPIAADEARWEALTLANRASSVAARCGVSPYVASLALRRARELVPGGSLEVLGAALDRGEIPVAKAELIADELAAVEDQQLARELVGAILPQARTLGVGRLREAVRAEVAHHQPTDLIATHETARQLREVSRPQAEGLGLASLRVLGPAHDIARLWSRIDDIARALKQTEHDEPIGAMRFDALIDVACRGPADAIGRASAVERRPAINVIVGIDTLLGSDQPAELDGYGMIDARTARQLAADPTGTWRRLLVDDTGRLVQRSVAYRPPPSMASYVLARDRTCRFPGCGRTRLDIDHIIEHDDGGPTDPSNLAGLCRTHHNLKTHRLWDYAIDPMSGDAAWSDRHGGAAVQPATRYRTATRRHRGIAAAMRRAVERRRAVCGGRGREVHDDDPPPF